MDFRLTVNMGDGKLTVIGKAVSRQDYDLVMSRLASLGEGQDSSSAPDPGITPPA